MKMPQPLHCLRVHLSCILIIKEANPLGAFTGDSSTSLFSNDEKLVFSLTESGQTLSM